MGAAVAFGELRSSGCRKGAEAPYHRQPRRAINWIDGQRARSRCAAPSVGRSPTFPCGRYSPAHVNPSERRFRGLSRPVRSPRSQSGRAVSPRPWPGDGGRGWACALLQPSFRAYSVPRSVTASAARAKMRHYSAATGHLCRASDALLKGEPCCAFLRPSPFWRSPPRWPRRRRRRTGSRPAR